MAETEMKRTAPTTKGRAKQLVAVVVAVYPFNMSLFPEQLPRRGRDLLVPGPLRLAVFDTCVLTNDIIATQFRKRHSSLLTAMRRGTIRGLVPHHVWAEVPRVLEDRHRAGEDFDLTVAQRMWWSAYVPVLHVVSTEHLPLTPEARILAERDGSDLGSLTLLAVLAPAALFTEDRDLLDSGQAYKAWPRVRAALGQVGPAEEKARQQARGVDGMMALSLHGTVAGIRQAARLTRAHPVVVILLGAVLLEGVRRYRKPAVGWFQKRIKPVLVRVGNQMLADFERMHAQHRDGEIIWMQAECDATHDGMLHRVAHLLACRGPMTRTEILKALGEIPGYRRRQLMDGLYRMLRGFPMFCEVAPDRWQIGRTGVDFSRNVAAK